MRRRTRKQKEIDFIKVCLLVVCILLIVFTVVMIDTFRKYGAVPDTLVTCFFATFSFEIIGCALIKIFKLKFPQQKDKEEENYD